MRTKNLLTMACVAMLLGCSTKGTQTSDTGLTPQQVIASGEARAAVHWGGQIVNVRNLRDRTLIEVLALPLDNSGRPQPAAEAQGRFIVDKSGFVEPHEYATDRLLEVRGQLNGFTEGRVGGAHYRYPVVISERLYLWPKDAGRPTAGSPRINFGLGVSNHGSGVGVGIGF